MLRNRPVVVFVIIIIVIIIIVIIIITIITLAILIRHFMIVVDIILNNTGLF